MAVVRVLRAFAAAVLFCLAPLPVLAEAPSPATSFSVGAEDLVETAPVTLDGRTLFRVRGVQAFPAERRATLISQRLLALARDPRFDPAKIDTLAVEGWVWIGAPGERIMRIHDMDGEVEGLNRFSLAELYANRTREAITAFRAARTREALTASAWRAALATALAVVVLVVLRLLFGALHRWETRHMQNVKGVSISSFELVGARHIWAVARTGLRVVFGLGAAVLMVFYLQYVLRLFPWTWSAGQQLSGWILAPLQYFGRGLLAIIPDLIFLLVLYIVARYLLRIVKSFFDSVGSGAVHLKGFYPEWAGPTFNLVRIGVVAFALVLAYPHIPGASSDAFKGVSIFMGAILSLGSTGVISNIIAGYTMVYRRAFREGDLIKIDDVIGFVTQIRLQVTHLRTAKNEEIIVPNVKILNSDVTNFTTLAGTDGLILHTTVGIGYETPWRQVEAMLIEAAERTPGVRKEPRPFVRQRALGDFAVTYEINAYVDTPNHMIRMYSDLHANILDLFNEHNVQIMTPAYEGDPEKPKVVPREEWYLSPAKPPAGPPPAGAPTA